MFFYVLFHVFQQEVLLQKLFQIISIIITIIYLLKIFIFFKYQFVSDLSTFSYILKIYKCSRSFMQHLRE